MKAMGFKDRGSSKYCFKNYEESPDESEEDADFEVDFNDQGFMLPKKRPYQLKQEKKKKYYDGPITFKNNLFGIGYVPTKTDI